VLLIPGTAGHAAQTAPRGLSLLLDWLHLVSASVWIGGLIGLLVLWWGLGKSNRVAGLRVAVPRFSNVAFVSVMVLLGSGIGATIIHMPTLAPLWQTSTAKRSSSSAALLSPPCSAAPSTC
jgi:copper transport protein